MRESPRLRILAAVRPLAVVGGYRLREQHTVGSDDRAARFSEVAQDGACVVDVVVERLRAEHLNAIELYEQQRVQENDGHTEPADLTVHPATSPISTRSC